MDRDVAAGLDPQCRRNPGSMTRDDREDEMNAQLTTDETRRIPGREEESKLLEAMIADACEGAGSAAAVIGEPGSGKTTLLELARELAADRMTVIAAGDGAAISASAELADALGEYAADLPDRVRSVVDDFAAHPDGFDPEIASTALADLFCAGLSDQAILWLVDGADDLDEVSRRTLAVVAQRVEDGPAVVLAAARSPEAIGVLEPIELEPVGPDGVRAIIGDVDEELAAQIAGAAGGNPWVISELRDLVDGGLLGSTPLPDPMPLSSSAQRVFASALEPLPPESRRALAVLAADDDVGPIALCEAFERLGIEAAALDPAAEVGVIERSGATIRFRSVLVRAAAYWALEPDERADVHRALAAARDSDPVECAIHHLQLAAAGHEACEAALERGAGAARRRADGFPVAALLIRSSAELASQPNTGRLLRASRWQWEAGDADGAARTLDLAGEVAGCPLDQAMVAAERGLRMMIEGPVPEGVAILTAAAPALGRDAPRHAATAAAAALLVGSQIGTDPASELLAHVAADDESDGEGRDELIALIDALGRGDDAASPLARLAERTAERPGLLRDSRLRDIVARLCVDLGEREAAMSLYRGRIDQLRLRRALGLLAPPLANLARAEYAAGRWAAAREHATEAARRARACGQAAPLTCALSVLAALAVATGEEGEAIVLAEEASEASARAGIECEVTSATVRGMLALGTGSAADAIEDLGEAVAADDEATEAGPAAATLDLVEALIRGGARDQAQALLDRVVAVAGEGAPALVRGRLLRCEAMLAAEARYNELFARARTCLVGQRFERARTELAWGERLRRSRRRIGASKHLRIALSAFEQLEARPWAERARRELEVVEASRVRRTESNECQLTRRELQICELVAQGSTNKEVAAQLYVSPKTVEYHLTTIYKRLGIRSRSELVRMVTTAELGEATARSEHGSAGERRPATGHEARGHARRAFDTHAAAI